VPSMEAPHSRDFLLFLSVRSVRKRISGGYMVGVRPRDEPRPRGLLGGEEALLGLGHFLKPSGGFFIRSWYYVIPRLSWGIMRHRSVSRKWARRITL
jgi:hypothetical protein